MYCIHDCAIISTKKFLEKKVIREDIRGDDISEGDIHVMVSSNT